MVEKINSVVNEEMIRIADSVAREKSISFEKVIDAMVQAIQIAGKRKYGHDHEIKAEIDKKTGEVRLYRVLEVVGLASEVEDFFKQISLEDAKQKDPEVEIGGFIYELLPPIDLGRVAAQTAKQVLVKNVKEAEREKQYEEFQDRAGEIMSGIVKREEFGSVLVDFGRAEAILTRDGLIKGEVFRPNDRIRAYVVDVRRETKGPQIFLSRACNEFLAKLFEQEVPEVYDGVILVKAVAREPGSRAKVAVHSQDNSIDAVASCVGVRGARVQAIIGELHGEKIDVIQWSADPATFVINAIAPAEISKVVIDEDRKRIELVVASDQLSLAIGRRGQNVRLASQLTGWNIDVLTEDQESKRRVEEFNNNTQLFMQALDVEEVLANLLAAEGFSKIEDVAYVPLSDLASIEGFDEDLASELQRRAVEYIETQKAAMKNKLKKLGVDKDLINLLNMPDDIILNLAENGIKSVEDLADLSSSELAEILPRKYLSTEQINALIMKARKVEKDGQK